MIAGRRRCLAGTAALVAAGACGRVPAQGLPGSFTDWRRLIGGPAAASDAAERERLLAEGEAQLTRGDAAAAQDTFQRAAQLMHAADTECSIVRAQMQAGQYRQALAFAAHAALAHRRQTGGLALYAWLLHAGGQTVVARRLVLDARHAAPQDAMLAELEAQLMQPWPRPFGDLLDAPWRARPYTHGDPAPRRAARVLGTATLVADGQSALVPRATIEAAGTSTPALWLRNGLGEVVAASAGELDVAPGLVQVRLGRSLPVATGLEIAARTPFAGSPVATVEFARSPAAEADWPFLHQGFLGRSNGHGLPRLGIELPPGARGGPVFDRQGRLAGVAVGAADGSGLLVARAALAAFHEGAAADTVPAVDASATRPGATMPVDAVYEAALHHALQVIAT